MPSHPFLLHEHTSKPPQRLPKPSCTPLKPWSPLSAPTPLAPLCSPAEIMTPQPPGQRSSCSHLDERHPDSIFLHVALELLTHLADELVGHHEQEDVGPGAGFQQVWLCHLQGGTVSTHTPFFVARSPALIPNEGSRGWRATVWGFPGQRGWSLAAQKAERTGSLRAADASSEAVAWPQAQPVGCQSRGKGGQRGWPGLRLIQASCKVTGNV